MPKKVQDQTKIVLKPLGPFGGLDNIHLLLIALVIILVALTVVVSRPTTILPLNGTSNLTCAYGALNGKCVVPLHNFSALKQRVGQILASYAYVNSSLTILAYYSSVQNMSAEYLPKSRQWLASVPIANPLGGNSFFASFLLYDSNFSLVRPYIQTATTSQIVTNYAVSQGVIRLNGKVNCLTQNPMQLYWFIDPYSPGSISTLNNLTSLQQRYGSKVNASLRIVYGQSSLAIATSQNNVSSAQALGRYLFCASKQSNFTRFVSNLQSLYANAYVPPAYLNLLANQSRLNQQTFSSCLANATSAINAQSVLAQYYNVTSTPSVVTNCVYQSIPQTTRNALCYANSMLC